MAGPSPDEQPRQRSGLAGIGPLGLLFAANQVFLLLLLTGWAPAPALVPLALLPAIVGVLLIPGDLILGLLGRRPRTAEWVPRAFGVSLIMIAGLTVLSIECGLDARTASAALLVGSLVLVGVEVRRGAGRRSEPAAPLAGRAHLMLEGAALAGLGVLFAGFLTVGGTMAPDSIASLEEEALHVTIVRKLADNPALTHTNVMYKPGVANTYVYPPYHFALAMVSRCARLDPLVVYLKLRPFAMVVSLLAMYGVALALFASRWIADLVLAGLVLLVANNAAGQVPGFYWAQLAPLSHLGDFGLGVLLPVLALFVFRYLLDDSPGAMRVLAPLMMATGLLVHTREVLQLTFFLAVTTAVWMLVRRDDGRTLARLLSILSATILLGLAYEARHAGVAGHAVAFEMANREPFRTRLIAMLHRPPSAVLAQANPEFYGLMGRPIFMFPLLAAPLLWRWRSFWAIFCASAFLATFLVVRIPYLSMLFVLATYSEMLQTPARFLFHWSVLLIVGALAAASLVFDDVYDRLLGGVDLRLSWGDRARAPLRLSWTAVQGVRGRVCILSILLVLAVALSAAFVAGVAAIPNVAREYLDALYVFGIVGSLAGLSWAWWQSRATGTGAPALPPAPRRPGVALAFGTALLLPLGLLAQPPSLAEQWRAWSLHGAMEDLWAWYRQSRLSELLPPHVVRFVRREIPPGQVFAAPYDRIFAIPLLANQYVISCGRALSTELDFVGPYQRVKGTTRTFPDDPYEAYVQRSAYAWSVMAEAPLFNARERPEETVALLRAYGVQYLVATPPHYERYEALRAAFPGVLEKLHSRGGYAVYRVRVQALPEASP